MKNIDPIYLEKLNKVEEQKKKSDGQKIVSILLKVGQSKAQFGRKHQKPVLSQKKRPKRKADLFEIVER